jgi:hypothetical protein
MSHAEICPICHGTGKLSAKVEEWVTTGGNVGYKTCHGCGGKGWIEVADSYAPIYPYPNFPSSDPYPWYTHTIIIS